MNLHILSWPRCLRFELLVWVFSWIASRSISGVTNTKGLTMVNKSSKDINGKRTHCNIVSCKLNSDVNDFVTRFLTECKFKVHTASDCPVFCFDTCGLALHQLHTARKTATSGEKNESLTNNSLRDSWLKKRLALSTLKNYIT